MTTIKHFTTDTENDFVCHFLLTHLHLDKLAAILADNICCEWKCMILTKNSLKFVPKGPINNKPALVQVMAWRWTGDKPLPELMLTQFTDAYMRH